MSVTANDTENYAKVMGLDDARPGSGGLAPRARFASGLSELSLDGAWRFNLSPSVAAAPVGIEEPQFDDTSWSTIPVPSNWPMHGHGLPQYTNVRFPFHVDPPFPPDENPIGDHCVTFDAPEAFLSGAVLRFDGIDSAGTVWLNGDLVGTTRGSRLMSEFDISRSLRATANVLVVRVAQFSAASYLEDQDMWWLPGIFRDVTLVAMPQGAIRDIFVHANYGGAGGGTLRVALDAPFSSDVRIAVPELGVFDLERDHEIALTGVEP